MDLNFIFYRLLLSHSHWVNSSNGSGLGQSHSQWVVIRKKCILSIFLVPGFCIILLLLASKSEAATLIREISTPSCNRLSLFIFTLSGLMEVEGNSKALTQRVTLFFITKVIIGVFLLLFVIILFSSQASPFGSSALPSTDSWAFLEQWKGNQGPSAYNITCSTLTSKLRDSVTFLPLKDLRFAETAMTGNTWFMSSLNDTHEKNETEYLYFPSQASKGRLLCIKGRNTRDGTKNSYALAWPESLPDSAVFMKGLTFASDTYYDYENLWHGLSAVAPFVGWSIKNGCLRPTRWVLFHWGELRSGMGPWLQNLTQASFGEVPVEEFTAGDGPYCFEKAVVMRHNTGSMGKEKRLQVFDLLRCKARGICGINPAGRGREVNEKGEPIIRLTLLMRRGSRSFKNATAVVDIFARECAKVEGCLLKVAQSEDLSFCDQVCCAVSFMLALTFFFF